MMLLFFDWETQPLWLLTPTATIHNVIRRVLLLLSGLGAGVFWLTDEGGVAASSQRWL
jgi:hypothetical protein